MPMSVNMSASRLLLTLRSRISEQDREGDRLTSRSQGFKLLSMSTSKPSKSKQFVLYGTYESDA